VLFLTLNPAQSMFKSTDASVGEYHTGTAVAYRGCYDQVLMSVLSSLFRVLVPAYNPEHTGLQCRAVDLHMHCDCCAVNSGWIFGFVLRQAIQLNCYCEYRRSND